MTPSITWISTFPCKASSCMTPSISTLPRSVIWMRLPTKERLSIVNLAMFMTCWLVTAGYSKRLWNLCPGASNRCHSASCGGPLTGSISARTWEDERNLDAGS
jgi:hypothetical protein